MSNSLKFGKSAVDSAKEDSFGLIPAGTYEATIFSVKEGKFGPGRNEGRPFWNVQYRISEGDYENRRVFQRIGLFTNWAPTEKNPDGASNFTLIQFLDALGAIDEDGDAEIPEIDDVVGEPVTIRIKVQKGTDQYPDDRNEVQRVMTGGASVKESKTETPPKKSRNRTL